MKTHKNRWEKSLCRAQKFYFRTSFVGYLQRWRFLYREMKKKRNFDRKTLFGLRKSFGKWADMANFPQAQGIYRKKALKKLIFYMKLKNSFDKMPLSRTGYDFSKNDMKKVFGFPYKENLGNKDLSKGEKRTNGFWHRKPVPWFFKAWNKLLHKRLQEKSLSLAVIKARDKQKSRIFFYEWVRKYNTKSSKRKKTQQKVHVFQLRWAKYKQAKIFKLWTKLYKSQNYYRKLKKISIRRHITKAYRRCFLGFFILHEKSKINKLKHYKAIKIKDKTLLVKSICGWVRYFNKSIRKKVAFGKAVKFWSMRFYKKIWMDLYDRIIKKKYRKNKEKAAWEDRVVGLVQEGVRMCVGYGLQEKSKRDEYIRALIVNEAFRTEKVVRKYAAKWLSFIRNKGKLLSKTIADPSSPYKADKTFPSFPFRKPPRRHVFL